MTVNDGSQKGVPNSSVTLYIEDKVNGMCPPCASGVGPSIKVQDLIFLVQFKVIITKSS